MNIWKTRLPSFSTKIYFHFFAYLGKWWWICCSIEFRYRFAYIKLWTRLFCKDQRDAWFIWVRAEQYLFEYYSLSVELESISAGVLYLGGNCISHCLELSNLTDQLHKTFIVLNLKFTWNKMHSIHMDILIQDIKYEYVNVMNPKQDSSVKPSGKQLARV